VLPAGVDAAGVAAETDGGVDVDAFAAAGDDAGPVCNVAGFFLEIEFPGLCPAPGGG
jgi:hypothetical protein